MGLKKVYQAVKSYAKKLPVDVKVDEKGLNKRLSNKRVIKQVQTGVVFSTEQPRSKYFKQEWERAKWV